MTDHVDGVATDNMGDVTVRQLVADFTTLATIGVRRIGWQEGGDRGPVFTAIRRRGRDVVLALRGWRTYRPLAIGAGSVPISWHRRTFERLDGGWRLCVPAQTLGPKGAGPTRSKPKGVVWIRVRHRKTGQTELHLNTHPIPSAERGDLSHDEHVARLENYEEHMRGVVQLVRELRHRFPNDRIVLTLDANAKPGSSLVRPLHAVGFTGWTTQGTHGPRNIDHVLVLNGEHQGAVDVSGRTRRVPALSGDHRKVVRWLTYRAAPTTARS